MAALPEPVKSLRAALETISGRVSRLERAASNKFSGTGLSVPADGVTQVDGSLVVQGGDAKSGNYASGSTGWHLGSDGTAEFTDIVILGVSVGDDAPVLTKTYKSAASGFGLGVPWAEKAGRDITVPTGCTRASVQVMGRMYAVNPNTSGGADTTGTDALYVQIGINGQFSSATPTGISGNFGFATTVGVDSFDLTGLTPGATIRLSVQGSSGYQSIAAYADNYIIGVASITWLR